MLHAPDRRRSPPPTVVGGAIASRRRGAHRAYLAAGASGALRLYRAGDDYRVPDQCYALPDQLSERGMEGAVLVVELMSPGDETYDKLDWYAAVGVDEVLVVDPETRTPEVFVGRGGRMVLSAAARLHSLGVEFEATTGPALCITWDGGSAEV